MAVYFRPITGDPDPAMVHELADAAIKAAKAYCYDHPNADFKTLTSFYIDAYIVGYNEGVMVCANAINGAS